MRDVVTTVGELAGGAAIAAGSGIRFGWGVGLIVVGVLLVVFSTSAARVAGRDGP